MDIIETKAQLHYRYMSRIFIVFFIFATFCYFFMNFFIGSQFVKYIVCLTIFIAVFCYIMILIKKLTKNVVFQFGEKLIIQIRDLKTNNIEEEHQIKYSEIKSCFLSSGSTRTCTFKLYFFDGTIFKLVLYSAEGQFTKAENIDGFQILKKLAEMNLQMNVEKPFLVSTVGTVALRILVGLFIIDIFINIKFGNSTAWLISLPTMIGLLLILLGTKKSQKLLYVKMIAMFAKQDGMAENPR